MKILWTETALRNLEAVPRIPAEQILEKIEVAAEFPHMYPLRQRGRHRGYHWLSAAGWLVFYEVIDDSFVVRAILHGGRRGA